MADNEEIKRLNEEIETLKSSVERMKVEINAVKKRSYGKESKKIRYVHKVETTVSQRDSFEEKVNEDIRILSELGAKIISFQLQNFGLSPMTKEMYIIYEMNEGEKYVDKKTFEERRKRDRENEKMQNGGSEGNKKTVESKRNADG